MAIEVDNVYDYCERLQKAGIPSTARRAMDMAFIRTSDNISIEILQKGNTLPLKEPWTSMPNVGAW